MKKYTTIEFIATFGEGHGKGHFSDLSFDTFEKAQAEIDKHVNIDSLEHRVYWNTIAENMKVVKRTSIITDEGVKR